MINLILTADTISGFVVAGAMFAVVCGGAAFLLTTNAKGSAKEQELEDIEQAKYLNKWREKQAEKHTKNANA